MDFGWVLVDDRRARVYFMPFDFSPYLSPDSAASHLGLFLTIFILFDLNYFLAPPSRGGMRINYCFLIISLFFFSFSFFLTIYWRLEF